VFSLNGGTKIGTNNNFTICLFFLDGCCRRSYQLVQDAGKQRESFGSNEKGSLGLLLNDGLAAYGLRLLLGHRAKNATGKKVM